VSRDLHKIKSGVLCQSKSVDIILHIAQSRKGFQVRPSWKCYAKLSQQFYLLRHAVNTKCWQYRYMRRRCHATQPSSSTVPR